MLHEGALDVLTDVLGLLRKQQGDSSGVGVGVEGGKGRGGGEVTLEEGEGGGDASLLVIGSQWESAVLIAEDVLYMLSEKNENMIAEIVEPSATSGADLP
jgi:hypothetical protein